MHLAVTPSFLDPIIADAFDQEPSLLVMARGLGLHIVLQRLVEANSGPEHLVLLLNTTKEDEQQLQEQCVTRGVVPPAIVNNECPAQERMELYLAGGLLAVTQRILVVDLLCERVPAAQVTGIIVANAHRVTEGGNLAFILRIFRQLNRTAFIKALSDDPPALTKGFAQVEKVMRWLRVRKLQLWPRFHVAVSACLDATQPIVEECSVSLSGKAKDLQQALLRAVDECLTELKGGSSAVDVSQVPRSTAAHTCALPQHDACAVGARAAHRGERSLQVLRRHRAQAARPGAPHATARLARTRGAAHESDLGPAVQVWHQISRRTKSLVADLRTLRQLLNFLVPCPPSHRGASSCHARVPHTPTDTRGTVCFQVRHDCVSFFEYLETVFDAASLLHPSERPHWLLNCSEDAFVLARDRVYALQRTQPCLFQALPTLSHALADTPSHRVPPTAHADSQAKRLRADTTHAAAAAGAAATLTGVPEARGKPPELSVRCVLEECPKWGTLCALLDEIRLSRAEEAGDRGDADETAQGTVGADGGVCTLVLVRDERTLGMVRELLLHGSRKLLEANFMQWVGRRRRSHAPSGSLISTKQHEAGLLRAAAAKLAGHLVLGEIQPCPLPSLEPQASAFGASGGYTGTRAKGGKGGRGGGGRGGGGRSGGGRGGGGSTSGGGGGGGSSSGGGSGGGGGGGTSCGGGDNSGGEVGDGAALEGESVARVVELLSIAGNVTLSTHSTAAQQILMDRSPSHVVLYDPEPAMVRAIELAQAGRRRPMHVYFLMQSDSVEEQKYRSALKVEAESFRALIHLKGHMAPPQEWAEAEGLQLPAPSSNSTTRRGGGRQQSRAAGHVVVDMREFRSALPNMLHLHGMVVRPVTLEVGDYVLTPEMVVERKSVSDLVGSLASGRLYSQAESMLRYYKRAVLLIEFEQGKPFSLQSASDVAQEISPNAITSKLSLLLIHHPKLRLLWSRSAAHTVAIFQALKSGQDEPDVQTAASLGGNAAYAEQVFNMTPQDVLRTLPGVHQHNYRRLMNAVRNLRELASKTAAELAAILGPQNASLLHAFLHREES